MILLSSVLGVILTVLSGVLLAAAVVGVVLMAALPSIGRWLLRRIAYPVLAGKPGQNMLLQTLVLLRLTDPETIISIMRRAETGKPFARPYGSTRRFKGMDELVFRPAQLARFPRREGEVETRTVIGPKARKPMELAIPLMVTGMAWGLALTREAKLAAAGAANLAGTCTNSGESGFVEEERKAADLYVVQYNRAGLGNAPGQLKRADMIEIQFGQGADASAAETTRWEDLTEDARRTLDVERGHDVTIHERFEHINSLRDLKRLVEDLKDLTGGAPIAVKLCAGDVEGDLEVAVQAGADVIVLDGAQGSTSSGYEWAVNDFGIPTMYAIPKAHRYLRKRGVRDRITLVASGGLRYSGEFLKAMALGADAIYVGLAAILAMVQAQTVKAIPISPGSELVLCNSPRTHLFDPKRGAVHLANFFRASVQEMKDAARALGKERLADISIDDLYALSWETAAITGARLVYAVPDGLPEMDGHIRPAYRMPEPTTEDAPPPVH